MTTAGIKKAAARAMVKFEVAQKVRELLDAARKEYGAQAWDEDEVEAAVLELVSETE